MEISSPASTTTSGYGDMLAVTHARSNKIDKEDVSPSSGGRNAGTSDHPDDPDSESGPLVIFSNRHEIRSVETLPTNREELEAWFKRVTEGKKWNDKFCCPFCDKTQNKKDKLKRMLFGDGGRKPSCGPLSNPTKRKKGSGMTAPAKRSSGRERRQIGVVVLQWLPRPL